MEVCVARGGFSVINLVRTMDDDGDDDTMNTIGSVMTDEITIHQLTTDIVEEDIGES